MPAYQLLHPARGHLATTAGRKLKAALSAAVRGRITGAHWITLLTAPRSAFGGPTSSRAEQAYTCLERVVTDYLRPVLASSSPAVAAPAVVATAAPPADTAVVPAVPAPAAPSPAAPAARAVSPAAAASVSVSGLLDVSVPASSPVVPPVGSAAPASAASGSADTASAAPAVASSPASAASGPAAPPLAVPSAPAPATLHEARAALPHLIKTASTGTPTPLVRSTHHALLTSPAAATGLGWDLTGADVHGTADARKRLGDLIQAAAEGHPQVLRRHVTPVAVLLPATMAGVPRPPADFTTTPAPAAAPGAGPSGPAEQPTATAGPVTAAPGIGVTPPSPTGTTPGTPPGTTPPPTPAAAAPATTAPADALCAVLTAQPAPGPAAPAAAGVVPPGTPDNAGPGLAPTAPATEVVPSAPAPAPATAPVQPAPAEGLDTTTPVHPAPGPTAPDAAAEPAAVPSAEVVPPAPTPAVPVPAAAVAARTPRRLAPLAQALDQVLTPTTLATPEGESTPATPYGLSTGITSLDEALGGLQPGRFYLVAAAPGAGGSLLAAAAARTTALDHHLPVLYAASGLTRQDVAARIVASHLPVDYRRLRAGRLNPTEQADVTALQAELAAAPLYIDDGTDLTHQAIAESVADLPGLALVVVDRLQTMDDPRLPLSGPRLTDAAQALVHLARTHHLPVIAALDTTDPTLIAALGLDVTLTLTRDTDQAHLTLTERDLGTQATLTLHADLTHARLTNLTPYDPHAGLRNLTPEEPRATNPTPAPEPPHPTTGALQAPYDPSPATPNAAWPPSPVAAPQPAAQTPAALDPGPGPDDPAPAPQTPLRPFAASGDTGAPLAAPTPEPATAPESGTPAPTTAARTAARQKPTSTSGGYAGRDYSYFTGMITSAVDQALKEHDGDIEAATEALVKKAVPNAMTIFEATRVGANYEHTVYPEILEFLRKKTRDGVDEIWEGRHNWNNSALLDRLNAGTLAPVTVDELDTNASFLTAFKTYLPIGTLIHQPDGGYDPKRSGVYRLASRPTWHHPHLPDPIGNRREEGPVLLDDATIRLLARCHRLGLSEAPQITECWTSGASEGLLEKFRRVLTEARETALGREADGNADGTVTVEYIKAMYSKFTSTMGESSANLEIRRPEWMHNVRSQAFANLWYKAYKAHQNKLIVVRVRGTDELHVTGGDWRTVFEEGRLTTQMKLKKQSTLPRKTAR